jgi:hypothetical protein
VEELIKKVRSENFKKRRDDNEKFFFGTTRFNFLNDQFGIRPGKIHLVVGPIGAGKSSIVRTMLADICANHKILLIATEEKSSDLETSFAYSKAKMEHNNLAVVEEAELVLKSKGDVKEYFRIIDWLMFKCGAEILVIDNLTSSTIYTDIRKSEDYFNTMKQLCDRTGIPLIGVCHTENRISQGDFYGANNIRGHRCAAIGAEYMYCLMRFSEKCDTHVRYASFVYVAKSRLHSTINTPYRLWFDVEEKQFTCDEKYSNENFKKFIKKGGSGA